MRDAAVDQAMNRDIVSVLLGGFGTKATGSGEAMAIEGEATMTTASDVAAALTDSSTVGTPPPFSRCIEETRLPQCYLETWGNTLRLMEQGYLAAHRV